VPVGDHGRDGLLGTWLERLIMACVDASRLPSAHPLRSGPAPGPPRSSDRDRRTDADGPGDGLLGCAWVDGGRGARRASRNPEVPVLVVGRRRWRERRPWVRAQRAIAATDPAGATVRSGPRRTDEQDRRTRRTGRLVRRSPGRDVVRGRRWCRVRLDVGSFMPRRGRPGQLPDRGATRTCHEEGLTPQRFIRGGGRPPGVVSVAATRWRGRAIVRSWVVGERDEASPISRS
jgi:hypothetical protein